MSTDLIGKRWRLNAGDEHTVMDERDQRLVSVPSGGMSGRTFSEASKIAGLIVAAPELYEALCRAPVPARGEEMMAFRDRQDAWLQTYYAPAIAKVVGDA